MNAIIWVTCDKHARPDEDCRRCHDAVQMNLLQAGKLRLQENDLDEWGRRR